MVLDAEAIAMARRLLQGIQVHTETLALELFQGIHFKGDFLKQRATRDLFPKEQYLPSPVIDRDSLRGWQENGRPDTFTRAQARVQQLIASYQKPALDSAKDSALRTLMQQLAEHAGMSTLPPL